MTTHTLTQRNTTLGRHIAAALATALLAAITLKWAWARIAVELFALPQARFAQAAAAVSAFVIVLLLARVILAATAPLRAP